MTVNVPYDVFKHVNMHGGDKDACWEWKGKVNAKDGRPYFSVAGKRRPSYVYALELHKGKATLETPYACHSCDNKRCCNPHHLNWGSHQDNMDDMVKRERHGVPAIVLRAIRKLLTTGKTQQEIADLYGLTREAISAIATGRVHKNKG